MLTSTKHNELSENKSSHEFIPATCHFDEHTIVTKNGELLQTIQINGINSENISDNLFNLRKVVRESIINSAVERKYAFWIHTIRRKANLADETKYDNYFCDNVNEIWKKKNYWDDKFVNTLYITIVHNAPELKLTNYSSFVNSLSPTIISNFENKFLDNALQNITKTSELILEGLKEYGAKKIGIRYHENQIYSDLMFLYRRIIQLDENDCLLPIEDISNILGVHKYTVGNDMIEVNSDHGKKFAAIMSIKEYQEVSSESLDKFLQIPVEMVATEVFYFINKKEVTKFFEGQNYILEVSKDNDLKNMKGLDIIFDKNQNSPQHFCHQQISFMVIGDDIKNLEKQVLQASEALSSIGIVHVREDVNLEKIFWAQLPANFAFLSRMRPTTINNTAALSSLHNFPTGNQYSPWGKAITLLRSEKGTPYFINFHDKTGVGNSCIFGDKESGKTTLLNFLLAETDKLNPNTLYISDCADSEIYIRAREGEWIDSVSDIVNPFLCKKSKENLAYLNEFFKIITQHYFNPLDKEDLKNIELISANLLDTPIEKRDINKIFSLLDKSVKITNLKKRLQPFLKNGQYANIFSTKAPINFSENRLYGINLNFLNEEDYIKQNYPKEKKLLEQFEYDLNVLRSLKSAIILAFHNIIIAEKKHKKIFAVDNLHKLLDLKNYQHLIKIMYKQTHDANGINIFTVGSDYLQKNHKEELGQDWIKHINTSFILPSHLSAQGLDEILYLNKTQFKKLSSLTIDSRTFLIKQDDIVIASELSIGGLPGLVRIFKSTLEDRKIAAELMQNYIGKSIASWVENLYLKFTENS